MTVHLQATVDVDLLANELLTVIEAREAGLMKWGFYDLSIDLADELPELLTALTPEARHRLDRALADGLTLEDLVDNLRERVLITRNDRGYRSRFAETVWLLSTVRQLFPGKPWTVAPTLVADLWVDVRRRRYPARDVPGTALLQGLRDDQAPSATIAGVERLITNGDGLMDLAAFQERSARDIVRILNRGRDAGIVIGAGTGSGKTKAFYVPALAHVAANLSNLRNVQALAIYPRIELLKDQFQEAYAEARKLDGLQASRGKRRVTIGAYYGDTPGTAAGLRKDLGMRDWSCPFLACPNPDCRGVQLVWRSADIKQAVEDAKTNAFDQHERLACPNGCGFTVEGGTVQLTRQHMATFPPDVLFTTTEMLNRTLVDNRDFRLFGIGVSSPPTLLLLDEIHAYEGLTGAQTAYLLRRWRHARGRHPNSGGLCIVGLSATLADAEGFFAQLTGLPRNEVDAIMPTADQMVEEGAEYNLVLKGDPVNRTALLSTSVQTAMLIGRIQDPPRQNLPLSESIARGASGRRTFAFTDQLDGVNRWHHYQLDAEPRQRLAALRSTDPAIRGKAGPQVQPPSPPRISERNEVAMQAAGQLWGLCERIGHPLDRPLSVGLVSSQQQISGQLPDVVIATSSLEVGFNDPEVGAVLQHKAPRSAAAFLQRKGRAGRPRGMRPWTVVVTSSYGRDRWAFQHAEELFQPTLRSIHLPTANIYVQKIQATYALMDWLAWEMDRKGLDVDCWKLLGGRSWYGNVKRNAMARLVADVLDGGRRRDLERHLRLALGLDEKDLAQVMWGDPRSLMLEVLPSMLRQLETDWRQIVREKDGETLVPGEKQTEPVGAGPLSDFVPQNLFSDLNLPELTLVLPGHGDRREAMNLLHGMTEFAPGKVSKRFARSDNLTSAHWLAPPAENLPSGPVELSDLVDLPLSPRRVELEGETVSLFRPTSYRLTQVPFDVMASSSAHLRWKSALRATARLGFDRAHDDAPPSRPAMRLPGDSPWTGVITGLTSYEHRHGEAVEVIRAATGVTVETRRRSKGLVVKSDARRHFDFTVGDSPAALGFVVSADGLAIDFEPLDTQALVSSPDWKGLRIGLVPICFHDALRDHPDIRKVDPSSFEIEWLWQLELAMLTATAMATGVTLEEAAAKVDERRVAYARRTLQAMFQAQPLSPNAEDDGGNPDPTGDEEQETRLQMRLMELEADPGIVAALKATRPVLWSDELPFLHPWLVNCHAVSLGSALFTALLRLVPDLDAETLSLDIEADRIWVTEATGGGVGHIGKLAQAIRSRPRTLALLLDDVTRHCDREAVAMGLAQAARLMAKPDGPLTGVAARVREHGTLRRQEAVRRELARDLESAGIPVTRELVVNLNAKLLRAHTSSVSDAVVAGLIDRWQAEEQRLGCAIDLRSFAVAAAQMSDLSDPLRTLLEEIGGNGAAEQEAHLFNVLQSMLWLSCTTSCEECIAQRNRFTEWPKASRALVCARLAASRPPVRFGEPGWEEELRARLAAGFAGSIVASHEDLGELKGALARLLTTPIELEFQVLYPTIERIVRDGHDWLASLVIREMHPG